MFNNPNCPVLLYLYPTTKDNLNIIEQRSSVEVTLNRSSLICKDCFLPLPPNGHSPYSINQSINLTNKQRKQANKQSKTFGSIVVVVKKRI